MPNRYRPFTVAELVQLAANIGAECVGQSKHDTARAYVVALHRAIRTRADLAAADAFVNALGFYHLSNTPPTPRKIPV